MKKTKKQASLWVVTMSGSRDVGEVARDLKKAGLSVDQVFESIGSITGTADAAVVARLRSIEGVADVSPNPSIDIGPPDSAIS